MNNSYFMLSCQGTEKRFYDVFRRQHFLRMFGTNLRFCKASNLQFVVTHLSLSPSDHSITSLNRLHYKYMRFASRQWPNSSFDLVVHKLEFLISAEAAPQTQ